MGTMHDCISLDADKGNHNVSSSAHMTGHDVRETCGVDDIRAVVAHVEVITHAAVARWSSQSNTS
jgi:hypothetical protein